MKKRHIVFNIAVYTCISSSIVIVFYLINISLLSLNEIISPTDALFLEGVVSILFGLLLLLGKGGINLWSQKAAILSATAEAVYGGETAGPDEIMRRDAWKAKAFIRAGLILVITGVFMLTVYLLTL